MKRVLVVEDDAFSQTVMKAVLMKSGYDVPDMFAYGEDAVTWLQDNACDVVVLDINLEGQNGLETLKQIRQDPKTCRLPVMIMSASWNVRIFGIGKALDVNGYTQKPMIADILPARLEKAIATKFEPKAPDEYQRVPLPADISSPGEFMPFTSEGGDHDYKAIASDHFRKINPEDLVEGMKLADYVFIGDGYRLYQPGEVLDNNDIQKLIDISGLEEVGPIYVSQKD